MALDKLGQHFYKSDGENLLGDMGIKTYDNVDYISFSLPCEYAESIENGLAWGITTPSDGKFHPILFLKNFKMANKQSDAYFGQLVLNFCDLVLSGNNDGIQIGNIRISTDALNNMQFEDMNTGEILLNIIPNGDIAYPTISMLNGMIVFYRNSGGTNTFKVGDVFFDDTGHIYGKYLKADELRIDKDVKLGNTDNKINFDLYVESLASIYGNVDINGNIYANNISSDRRIKKNIKNSTKKALDIIKQIKHKQFEMKKDNKHYDIGYIAQEMEKIDPNFVLKREKTEDLEERYYINELPIIATATKAIQEQQEQIEQLKERIKKLEGGQDGKDKI